ncbi:CAP domain-containing protein [Microbaculum marinisediminis]|uniref:CAP domain-containing protein n=1 Tax=Microbaculum marinisediminis TaxID=2931392 RepID=A0AAW5R641_9HYPH|nr:CAP domain-containing protein [Microbaculum sp. A6E488]MCT8974564.1 CAP domain-containing protein [Microbaculum sp. A6E488]
MIPFARAFVLRLAIAAVVPTLLTGCFGPDSGSRSPLYANLAEVAGDLDEASALGMVNAYRAKNGLSDVTLDDRLNGLARDYARDLAAAASKGAAIRPDGKLEARLAAAGYETAEVKESVSAGYYTLAEAFSGWRDSEPHRDTMLFEPAENLGIAAVYLPGTKYKVYWVLIMAKPT